jgi:hypothetical protein
VLVAAYPVVTTLVVVATGNHFFLDALAGTLLAGPTWAVISRLDTRLSFIDTIVYRLLSNNDMARAGVIRPSRKDP